MFLKPAETIDPWSGPATAAFEFWISFWPTAPLFGVEWRFADAALRFGPAAAVPAKAEKPIKTKVKAAAKATEAAAPVVELASEPAPVPEIAPVTEVAPAPEAAPAATPAPVADPSGRPAALLAEAPADADDLTRIKGIGAGMAKQLNELGIYKLAQLAAFTPAELGWLDENLNGIKGALFRGDWAGQAKALIG